MDFILSVMCNAELLHSFKQKRDMIRNSFIKILTLSQDKNPALKLIGHASPLWVIVRGFSRMGRCHAYHWTVNVNSQYYKYRAGEDSDGDELNC